MWIYQMNQKDWPPENFRCEIWEEQCLSWGYRKKMSAAMPAPGDTLVFFYASRDGKDLGIYGWAVIVRCSEKSQKIYFRPTTPTNHLKMDPWWDEAVQIITKDVRGPMPRATLFPVQKKNVSKIRWGIQKWLCSGAKRRPIS
jgi:hypothetical protein